MSDAYTTGRPVSDQHGRVMAVLGPTNTGKTYLAMERMLAHRSGMIGFPLRLLARENYDKVVRLKGPKAVALVTGEEKIIPPAPQYWVCTVESMPLDRQVQFLAVDEIQLCADPERGHIFTDRLLHARGSEETMFLGADTIRGLIQKLVPRAEYISRPRFSNLSHAGHKKLTRLPPRSAIVAFSVTDVYAMAEMVRRSRGGTAVVMGALSPRTRNAQVAMYQAGDVDYLVATDAVGMGLNMDVDSVWFARLSKFDGHQPRRLKATEVAQIAGRAGRHLSDGLFGTTWDCEPMDEELVEAVENHSFPPLQTLMWRNADLDFRSLAALQRSLDARPFTPELIRAREADDQLALQILAKEAEVAALCTGPAAIRLLWEVCQVPDFRKVLSDAHTRLLGQMFRHLSAPGGRLPEDWVAGQVARLDRTEGDIDALVARIAHVRTWTYVSHRADWMADPAHWQERTRAIEDRLSDALHERLTQRFVDKRSAGLVKSLRDGRDLAGSVAASGEVMVEGHPVGQLQGLRFILDAEVAPEDQRALMTAARRALKDEIAARVRSLESAADDAFALADDGGVAWEGAPVGKLAPGPSVLRPEVRTLHDELLDGAQRDRVRQRLTRWVQEHVAAGLAPLLRLETAELTGGARGIAFQVAEALGALPRPPLEPLIAGLDKAQRRQLAALGLRLGFSHVFLPQLVKPRAVALRAMLWAVRHNQPLPAPVPPAGRVSVPAADLPGRLADAVGYPRIGPRAIRIDMLDRLEKELATRGRSGPLTAVGDLASLLGCSGEELGGVLTALGWRPRTLPAPQPRTTQPQSAQPQATQPAAPEAAVPEAAGDQDAPGPADTAPADALPEVTPEVVLDAAPEATSDAAPETPVEAVPEATVTVWVRRRARRPDHKARPAPRRAAPAAPAEADPADPADPAMATTEDSARRPRRRRRKARPAEAPATAVAAAPGSDTPPEPLAAPSGPDSPPEAAAEAAEGRVRRKRGRRGGARRTGRPATPADTVQAAPDQPAGERPAGERQKAGRPPREKAAAPKPGHAKPAHATSGQGRPARAGSPDRDRGHRGGAPGEAPGGKGGRPAGKPQPPRQPAPRPIDPDHPFAALAKLARQFERAGQE